MKKASMIASLVGILVFTPTMNYAQTGTNSTTPAVGESAAVEKHVKPIMAALKLTDPVAEAKVQEILAAQFRALRTWHAANDPQIKTLWSEFDHARSTHNVTNANTALDKIDSVYASFKPQHEKFVTDLSAVLTPKQVETVKDVVTVNKVKVTYDVYLQIFPTLNDAQKAVVLQNLKAAREEAIDCEAMKEKSAFFKKYKIKIEEDYLTAQGYDPKKARQDFAAQSRKKESKPSDQE